MTIAWKRFLLANDRVGGAQDITILELHCVDLLLHHVIFSHRAGVAQVKRCLEVTLIGRFGVYGAQSYRANYVHVLLDKLALREEELAEVVDEVVVQFMLVFYLRLFQGFFGGKLYVILLLVMILVSLEIATLNAVVIDINALH